MAEGTGQLVGRAAELAALDEALAGLARGGPGALAVAGEPGIGKTRLLAELAERAGRERLVLSGSASELERDLPFGSFVDALDEYVRALEPHRLRDLDDESRAEVAHVLPSLPAAGASGVVLAHERYRIHRAVRRLLTTLATPRPLVLILDDFHWADSGSIELLGMLLRRPPPSVLLAVGVRPRQMPDRLVAALERAQRVGALRVLALGALTEDDSRQLLAGVDGRAAGALHRRSGGNPFYLQQLARSLERRHEAPDEAARPLEGVPREVATALVQEIVLLDDQGRRVLEGAAVAGDPFEPELAAAAAGLPELAALEALDELLRRDLVRPTDVPRRFRFRHPLVRQAVYETTPAGWRLGAHERAAALLADGGATAPEIAHHVEQSGRHGDRDAIAVLRQAGEAVAQRTPAGAARWFAAALRLLPANAPADERIGLLTSLSGALAASGQLREAHDALLECLRLAPADLTSPRVRLIAACAGIEQILGRADEARARLEETLAGLGDAASPAAAEVMVDLGVGAFHTLDFERSHAWGHRALAVATALDDAPLTAAAAAIAALSLAFSGAGQAAEHDRERAAALVDAMADDALAVRLDAIAHLATAEGYLDRFEPALAHARRGIAVARASGQDQLFPVLILAVNTALFGLGRFTEAAHLLDGEIEGARLTGIAQPLTWNLLSAAAVRMMTGDLDTALTLSQESVELCRGQEVTVISSLANVIFGLILIERGEPERGVMTLVATGGGESLPGVPGNWRAWCLERLAQGLLALGRRDEAAHAAAAARDVAAQTELPLAVAAARRAHARVLLDRGEPAAAFEAALTSAQACEGIGAVAEAALSRLLAGRALTAAGEPARAAAELELAAAALEACGALRYRDQAERELGRLGRRRRRTRPDGDGLAALTERERQVARLIVDRRTNAQIAGELYLSTKTVESHVRNLFQKLAVSSRAEVARTVERADWSRRE
jgi:ATP/maltotriose-dependent transcriptional regulator MalT